VPSISSHGTITLSRHVRHLLGIVIVGLPGPGKPPDVTHQWLVLPGLEGGTVAQVPASVTKIIEAREVSAEVWSLLHTADRADCVLQVGVHLHLFAEPRRFYLDEGGSYSLHV